MGGTIRTLITVLVLLSISLRIQFCDGFSNFSNASSEGIAHVCQTLVANHSMVAPGVTMQDPFKVTLHVGSGRYTPGTKKNITVSLRHAIPDPSSEQTLKGFIVQARKVTALNTPEGIGTWLPSEDADILQCGENSTAVVQRDGSIGKKLPITIMFNAPPMDVGSIIFLASWVEDLSTHSSEIFYSTALLIGTPCEDSPCRNGGQCTEDSNDIYGRGHTCSCQPGTKGINCEDYVCTQDTCGPNQLCYLDVGNTDPNNLHLCKCNKAGYSGENCDEGPCSKNECFNGGTCIETNIEVNGNYYSCKCPTYISGQNCEVVDPCASSPCKNTGSCIPDASTADGFTCDCSEQYAGNYCEKCVQGAELVGCENGGTCNFDVNQQPKCLCPPGYYLNDCSYHICEFEDGPCGSVNKQCVKVSGGSGFDCNCTILFTNYPSCTERTTVPLTCDPENPCLNGGTCTTVSTPPSSIHPLPFDCACTVEYTGDICGTRKSRCEIAGFLCKNGGVCNNDETAPLCNCPYGYNDTYCENATVPVTCDPENPCLNGGTCTAVSTPISLQSPPFDCACTIEYTGEICETLKSRCEIAGFPCRNGGVCNNDETAPLCTCPYGYNDTYCQNDFAPPELGCTDKIIPGNGLYEYQLGSLFEFDINVTDNSKAYFLSVIPTPPVTIYVGIMYIVVRAFDLSNNQAECAFKIVLPDTIPPTVSCPPNTLYTSMPGESTANILLPMATSSDNYGNVTVSTETNFGSVEAVPHGTHNITVIAVDDDGNNNSCYYWIQVENPQLFYVVFSVDETFLDSYSNASSPEYQDFILRVEESMLTEMNGTSFADAYSGFLVHDLRSGSIDVNGVVMMNSNINISDPNAVQDLTNALNDSIIANGQLGNMSIIEGSFGVSDNVCVLSPCLNGGVCLGGEINSISCDCSNTGYEGQICDVKIDYCANSPCQNEGICTSISLSFTCECSVDYTGDTCQTIVDHCAGSPCNNGGTCTSGSNATYTCDCTVDYTGDNCETQVDHCANAPCQNEGICTSETNGMYTCACTVDYTGDNCEQLVDHCAGDPCINGGTCTSGTLGTYTCACTAGFTGDTCETVVDFCADGPCQNGGNCTSGADKYTCACTEDFMGENCTVIVDHCTTRTPCDNGGTCTLNEGGGYSCSCTLDYTGLNCLEAVDHCASEPCLNGAACTSQFDGRFNCDCTAGFSGTTCADIDPCNPNDCQNGGTCVPVNQIQFLCLCTEGFEGDMCQTIVNPCDPNPCQNDGTCIGGEGTIYTCMCGPGFMGVNCTVKPCDSSPCQNNGTCENVGEEFTCTCDTGYIGATCGDIDSCEPNPCQNGGVCTLEADSYACDCTGTTFTGAECQTEVTTPCFPQPCQNGGTCQIDGENFSCLCVTGWEGDNCQIDLLPCNPNPCENGNDCVVSSEPGQYRCTCGVKWTGNLCEIDLTPCDSSPCANNGICLNLDGGNFNCTCDEIDWTGPFCKIDLTPCTPNPCFNMGTCTEGPVPESFNCTCNETEWTGDNCEIDVTPCEPLPCLNGGNCTELGPGNFSCMCEENQWTGDICEIDLTPCDPLPCENNGTCTESIGVYSCNCTEKWGGQDCTIYLYPCELLPCQNNGICQNGTEPGSYSCNCQGYWEGTTCETLGQCTSNVCQNGGTCSPSADGLSEICQCPADFEGDLCQIQIDSVNECDSNPCQNGGTCANLIGMYFCTCGDAFEGLNCETNTVNAGAQTASSSSWWIIALCLCFLIIIGIAAVFVCVSMSKKSSS